MSALPIALGVYQRLDHPITYLTNMMFETAATNARDQVGLVQQPGTSLFTTAGSGRIRLIHRDYLAVDSNALWVVSGAKVYRVSLSTAVADLMDDLSNNTGFGTDNGITAASVAQSQEVMYFNIGQFVWPSDALTVKFEMPSGEKVGHAVNFNGYDIFVIGDNYSNAPPSNMFFWRQPNASSIDALDFSSAEVSHDALLKIVPLGDVLYLLGLSTIEPWQATGNPDAPFARIVGAVHNIGLAYFTDDVAGSGNKITTYAPSDTICEVDGALIFVASDLSVRRMQGAPERISEPWIDGLLRLATHFYAYRDGFEGHLCYVLNITLDAGNRTVAWDSLTGKWHERSQYGTVSCQLDDGRWLIGGTAGQIYILDPDVNTLNGVAMTREWSGLVETNNPTRCNNVNLDCTVGGVDAGAVSMRISQDRGRTFEEWQEESLGDDGDYETQVTWGPQGLVTRPGWIFHFKTTSNLRFTVRKASINEGLR